MVMTMNPEIMKTTNDVQALASEYRELVKACSRLEIAQNQQYDALCRRIDGMWWKIGLLAGVVSILMAEVFGHSAMSIFNALMSGLGGLI